VKLPLRFTMHIEFGVDRPGEQDAAPAVDQGGAVIETSHHEGPPELGLTPRQS
jgi:hypothetical protein